MKELAEQNLAKAHYASAALAKASGAKILFDGAPRFHEFVMTGTQSAAKMNAALLGKKIIGGPCFAQVVSGAGRECDSVVLHGNSPRRYRIDAAADALAGMK